MTSIIQSFPSIVNAPMCMSKTLLPDIQSLYDIYKTEFIDNCDQILLLKEQDFFKSFFKTMTLSFLEDYGPSIFDNQHFLTNIKECERRIKINQYKQMHTLCQNALQSYFLPRTSTTPSFPLSSSQPKEYGMLTNFRSHCCSNTIPTHTCRERFITVFNPKHPNKPQYVICTGCKMCYYESSILMLCVHCKKEFYSSVISQSEKELPPATLEKLHCNVMYNTQLTCINCGDLFWIKNSKLFCKKCKLLISPYNITWNCFHCHKDFQSGIKVYNPLEYKIIKLALRHALLSKRIVKPKAIPCKCYNDLTRVKFYHRAHCKGILYYVKINHKDGVMCNQCYTFSTLNKFDWMCPKCKKLFNTKQISIYENDGFDFLNREYESEHYTTTTTTSVKENCNGMNTPNVYHSSNNNLNIRGSNSNTLYNSCLLNDLHQRKYTTNTNKSNYSSQHYYSTNTNNTNSNSNNVQQSEQGGDAGNNNNGNKKRNYSITLPHQGEGKGRKAHNDDNTNNNNEEEEHGYTSGGHVNINSGLKIKIEKKNNNNNNNSNNIMTNVDTFSRTHDKNIFKYANLLNSNNNNNTSSNNIPTKTGVISTTTHTNSNVNSQRCNTIENDFKEKNGFISTTLPNFNTRVSTSGKSTSSERPSKLNNNLPSNINMNILRLKSNRLFLQCPQLIQKTNTKESLSSERKGKIVLNYPTIITTNTNDNLKANNNDDKHKEEYKPCNTQSNESVKKEESHYKIRKISINKNVDNKKTTTTTTINNVVENGGSNNNSNSGNAVQGDMSCNNNGSGNSSNVHTKNNSSNVGNSGGHTKSNSGVDAVNKVNESNTNVNVNVNESNKENKSEVNKDKEGNANGKDGNSNNNVNSNSNVNAIANVSENNLASPNKNNDKTTITNTSINMKVIPQHKSSYANTAIAKDSLGMNALHNNNNNININSNTIQQNTRINTSPGKQYERTTHESTILKSPFVQQKTTSNTGNIQKYIITKSSTKTVSTPVQSTTPTPSVPTQKPQPTQTQPSITPIPKPSSSKVTTITSPPQNPPQQPQQQQQSSSNDELKEFVFEDYTIITQLGQGTFGKIYLVSNKHTNLLYSMKKIILSEELDLELIIKEYQLCHKLKHNNIVEILGIYKNQLDITTYVIYILMEVGMNDWEKEIKSHADKSKPYTESELINILTQLISCLSFLQSQGVSHRDIKPQNVLIFKGSVYKIADFGEAKQIEKISQHRQINTLRGTELYMSPLLYNGLRCNQLDIKHNLFKSDVYSLGLCMLFAATLNVNAIYEIRKIVDMKNVRMFLGKLLGMRYSEGFIKKIGDLLELNEMNRPDFLELKKQYGV